MSTLSSELSGAGHDIKRVGDLLEAIQNAGDLMTHDQIEAIAAYAAPAVAELSARLFKLAEEARGASA